MKKITVFDVVNTTVLLLLAIICILPFVHILAVSLSSGNMSAQNLVGLIPKELTWDAYAEVFQDAAFFRSGWISVLRVFLGTVITMVLTMLAAYPLSFEQAQFPGRQWYVWFLMITMLFSGGMIPAYILVNRLDMVNKIWAIVIPGALPVFNVIVLLNFFRGIPKSLTEAAMIDGANDFHCFFRIYLPLATPCLATLTLFCIIGHWNAWFDGMIYMRDPDMYPLQTYMQVKFEAISTIKTQQDVMQALRVSERGLKAAYTVLSLIPIVAVFPFVSKYIKNGLLLGSVKE